jgi:hypothetical protein
MQNKFIPGWFIKNKKMLGLFKTGAIYEIYFT